MSIKSVLTDLEEGLAALAPEERARHVVEIRTVVGLALGSSMSQDMNERLEAACMEIGIKYKTRGKSDTLGKVKEVLPACPNVAAICAGLLPES